MASTYANFLEQKRAFTKEKSSVNSHRIGWHANKAAISLFWNTNMAAVTFHVTKNAP